MNITLSPHAQQLDFNSMTVYNVAGAEDEDEDDYDPSQLESFLPGGGVNDYPESQPQPQEENTFTPVLPGTAPALAPVAASTPYDPASTTTTNASSNESEIPLKKLLPPFPTTMANSLLAITHAPPTASPSEVRDASIMGFLYVADVDVEKGKMRVLAPMGGRVPPRAAVWGRRWPGEVVGLVG